jgi:hypothetical protein
MLPKTIHMLGCAASTYWRSTPQLADFSRALPLDLFQQPATSVLQPTVKEMQNEYSKGID